MLLPAHSRHLDKLRLTTKLYSLTPGQPETIEKSRQHADDKRDVKCIVTQQNFQHSNVSQVPRPSSGDRSAAKATSIFDHPCLRCTVLEKDGSEYKFGASSHTKRHYNYSSQATDLRAPAINPNSVKAVLCRTLIRGVLHCFYFY